MFELDSSIIVLVVVDELSESKTKG